MVRMASSSSLNRRDDEFVSFVDELKFQRIVRSLCGRGGPEVRHRCGFLLCWLLFHSAQDQSRLSPQLEN